MSIYLSKKENVTETAKNFFQKTRIGALRAKQTAYTMAWITQDVNARIAAGNQRAFGRKRF